MGHELGATWQGLGIFTAAMYVTAQCADQYQLEGREGRQALTEDAPMPNKSHVLRFMAAKYLRLARSAGSAAMRSKYSDYAMLYAQLSEQSERHANTHPVRERAPGVSEDEGQTTDDEGQRHDARYG